MKLLFDTLIAVSTVVSGFYWYRSSKVTVGPGTGGPGDVEIICHGDGTKPPWEVVGTIREQTRLNKTAAFWAVVTAALVVINLGIQNFPPQSCASSTQTNHANGSASASKKSETP